MAEALAAMEPCPAEYQPPPLHEGDPPFEDEVERPAGLPELISSAAAAHGQACRRGADYLNQIAERIESTREGIQAFDAYADALEDAIDTLSDTAIEGITDEIAEAAEAAASRGEDVDTFPARYAVLNRRAIQQSPELYDASMAAAFAGVQINIEAVPTDPEVLEEAASPWNSLVEARARAAEYRRASNDYQRAIHEGPDAPDPDEAAPGWGPATGHWIGRLTGRGRTPIVVEIRITEDGPPAIEYPANPPTRQRFCGGTLEDGDPSDGRRAG